MKFFHKLKTYSESKRLELIFNKSELFENSLNELEKLINTSSSYDEYIERSKKVFNKYDLNSHSYKILDAYINNKIASMKESLNWEDIDKFENNTFDIPLKLLATIDDSASRVPFNEYIKEELLALSYYDEKYLIPFIFNNNYSLDERKRLIEKYLRLVKPDEELYEFISDSIMKQIKSHKDSHNELISTINKLNQDKIDLLSLIEKHPIKSIIFVLALGILSNIVSSIILRMFE